MKVRVNNRTGIPKITLYARRQDAFNKSAYNVIHKFFGKDETLYFDKQGPAKGCHPFSAGLRDLLQNKVFSRSLEQAFISMLAGEQDLGIHVGSKFAKVAGIYIEALMAFVASIAYHLGLEFKPKPPKDDDKPAQG